jgi:sugar-specific transcriptional regulator TrmB
MSVDLISEVWNELKRYINAADHNDAAETMVNILIDNDVDADDIRHAFPKDAMIKRILSDYVDDEEVDHDFDEYEEDE